MLRSSILALIALAVMLGGAPAAGPPIPEQREQVEQIIHDYLMKNPEFLIEVLKAADAKQKQQQEEHARAALAAKRDELLNDPSSPVGGNPHGDVTIVEFFDYRCPYCKQVQPLLEALLKEDSKLRIVYKEFPILGPESVIASRVALAALRQHTYEPFHAAMMAAKSQITEDVIMKVAADAGLDIAKVKTDMNAQEIDEIIKRNYDLAHALNIAGTPTFIIGDTLIPGAVDLATLKRTIAGARKSR